MRLTTTDVTLHLDADVQVLKLEPGDVLAVTLPAHTPQDVVEAMAQKVRARFDPLGVPVVVMARDLELSIIRRAE